jgi:hypothetical protein
LPVTPHTRTFLNHGRLRPTSRIRIGQLRPTTPAHDSGKNAKWLEKTHFSLQEWLA